MKSHIQKFKKAKILVVGDLMLDKYIKGDVSRICPEAPVPVVNVQEETFSLGGAANVAANIVALGGQCTVVGLIGEDTAKEKVLALMADKGINSSGIVSWINPTIQKIRVMSQNQHLVRIDYERKQKNTHVAQMCSYIEEHFQEFDLIIVSDYDKGVICKDLMDFLLKLPKTQEGFISPSVSSRAFTNCCPQ